MTHTLDLYQLQSLEAGHKKALIMLHGRGGNARDITALSSRLHLDGYAVVAPQATNNTWYPYSFMAPVAQNEPSLSSALDVLSQTVDVVSAAGIAHPNMYFFGFSQGACLMLEFLARNASRYGGAVGIIGGLIGEELDTRHYSGDFNQTPIFIGTSNPDPHVPVERVYATKTQLEAMHAEVILKVYDHAPHTVLEEEIQLANDIIFHKK